MEMGGGGRGEQRHYWGGEQEKKNIYHIYFIGTGEQKRNLRGGGEYMQYWGPRKAFTISTLIAGSLSTGGQ